MEFTEHYFLVPIFDLLVCVWKELENTKKKDDKNDSFQVRHNMETNKFGILSLTPGRYKNIKGMLNPRPFMSKRRGKRFLDCIDKDIGVRPH